MDIGLSLKEFPEPLPHPLCHPTEQCPLCHASELTLMSMLGPVLDKAHRCRIDGARHDVDETRHPCGNSPPHRDLENFLGELRAPPGG